MAHGVKRRDNQDLISLFAPRFALCAMRYALCAMRFALCSLRYAKFHLISYCDAQFIHLSGSHFYQNLHAIG
jgi:hypothetical protein